MPQTNLTPEKEEGSDSLSIYVATVLALICPLGVTKPGLGTLGMQGDREMQHRAAFLTRPFEIPYKHGV